MPRHILRIFLAALTVVIIYLMFRVLGPTIVRPAFFFGLMVLLLSGCAAIAWLPLYFWTSTNPSVRPYEPMLERFAHVSMGVLSILVSLAIVRDLGMLVLWPFGHAAVLYGPTPSMVILLTTALLALIGYLNAMSGPIIRKVRIGDPSLQKILRIVQISDLHVGVWIGKNYVEKVVRQIESLGPIDFMMMTGDIGDGDATHYGNQLRPLGRIFARSGKFSVTGNHEGYWNEAEWNSHIRALGFRVLENEGTRVETIHGPVTIHGIRDGHPNPAQALTSLRPDVYSIYLAHQPHHGEDSIKIGVRLQLSGHTHAGQFLPWSLVIPYFHRYAAGLYQIRRTSIYVNGGTGFWGPPFRLGTRSEITLLEIAID